MLQKPLANVRQFVGLFVYVPKGSHLHALFVACCQTPVFVVLFVVVRVVFWLFQRVCSPEWIVSEFVVDSHGPLGSTKTEIQKLASLLVLRFLLGVSKTYVSHRVPIPVV